MIRMCEAVFWLSLLVFAYSYFIYPVLVIILAKCFGRPTAQSDTCFPTVGILVPVHNEESVIRRKIENILDLDYPPERLSVWIGSDCSTDRSEEIVKEFTDPRVHLWRAPARGGKTGILNGLAPQIDAEVILFTDANTMHRKNSLGMMVRHFADVKVGAVAGNIEHVIGGGDDESAETFYRLFESRQKLYEGMLHSTISAFGGFYAIRKQLFRPIHDNAYSNDDVMIPMNIIRQGMRVVYDPEAVSEEDTTEKVSMEYVRRIRIGAGNFQAFFWLLDFCNPARGWPFFCYVSHKATRWFSPLFLLSAGGAGMMLFVLDGPEVYRMLFAAGMVLIVAGLLFKIVPLRITRHIFYFMTMNFALILGLFRYLGGIKSAAWSRTERSS